MCLVSSKSDISNYYFIHPCFHVSGKQHVVSKWRNDVTFSKFICVDSFFLLLAKFHFLSKLAMSTPLYESERFVKDKVDVPRNFFIGRIRRSSI